LQNNREADGRIKDMVTAEQWKGQRKNTSQKGDRIMNTFVRRTAEYWAGGRRIWDRRTAE
jgi:hypothetical protein